MNQKKSTPATTSQRAYARHRGCTPRAVKLAIDTGRLSESLVVVDGTAKIADVEAADREWAANTRSPTSGNSGDVPPYAESRARREAARAELAEIELAQRRGELVEVATVRGVVIERFTEVKNKLLGLPAKIMSRRPHLSAEDIAAIDELIREALEALADEDTTETHNKETQ